jgi:hypothetical protein
MNSSCSSDEQRLQAYASGIVRAMLPLCLAAALAACGEEQQEHTRAKPPPAPPAIYQLDHIDVAKDVSAERWLASREAGRDLPAENERVMQLRHMLDAAGRRFREYPRMIANRAVQLESMLKEKGFDERAPELIARIDAIPGDHRYVESFGGLCQQYFNLRMQGHAPGEAVKILKDHADAS